MGEFPVSSAQATMPAIMSMFVTVGCFLVNLKRDLFTLRVCELLNIPQLLNILQSSAIQ
jgi:hypothetical protein